jgi:hypothetical protein
MDIDYNPQKIISNRFEKYYLDDRKQFFEDPKPLGSVIEIQPADVRAPLLTRLNKLDSLNVLITHSYRQEMMRAYRNNVLKKHLHFCSSLAMVVPVYRLLRPLGNFTIDEQIAEILKNTMYKKMSVTNN